jgi:methyl-accepting chemotaxis protein
MGPTVLVVIALVTLSIDLRAPAGAREALEEILGKVDRTAQAAKQISVATQQQRTASDQIVASMRELADVMKQTAADMKRPSVAAGELNQLAVGLKARLSAFQVT